jgi:hypothetical protein
MKRQLTQKEKDWIHQSWLVYKRVMNKQQIISALHAISRENEMQPAGEHQTRVATMLSDLGRKIESNGEFPQPCEWIEKMPLLTIRETFPKVVQ